MISCIFLSIYLLTMPIFKWAIPLTINSYYSHKKRKKIMLRIFKDTYRNVDTAEYCCSTGGFLWIFISCAEYLHAWIWWICVCLNFPWPPVLIYCNPSPISESFNTTPKDSCYEYLLSVQGTSRSRTTFPSLKAPLWARPSPVDTDVEKSSGLSLSCCSSDSP